MKAPSSNSDRIPVLDGIRGLAVLIVVAYHTGGGAQSSNFLLHFFGITLKAAWSGVTLFFILSGFLITGILWDSKGAPHWWRDFYVRRLLRISPLYYAVLALNVVVACFQAAPSHGLAGLWIYALYLQNIPGLHDYGSGIRPLHFTHLWSLAVEEQFYLLWPLALTWCTSTRQMKRICLCIFGVSFLYRQFAWFGLHDPTAWVQFLPGRAGELVIGAWLAMSYRDGNWPSLCRLARWLTPASFLAFVISCLPGRSAELTSGGCSIMGLAWIALFYAGLIVLALSVKPLNQAMSWSGLRWVGRISYGIYVFHVLLEPFFAWLTIRVLPHGGRLEVIGLRGLITWFLTLFIAWLSYRFFEAPILSLRRYFQPRPVAVAVG